MSRDSIGGSPMGSTGLSAVAGGSGSARRLPRARLPRPARRQAGPQRPPARSPGARRGRGPNRGRARPRSGRTGPLRRCPPRARRPPRRSRAARRELLGGGSATSSLDVSGPGPSSTSACAPVSVSGKSGSPGRLGGPKASPSRRCELVLLGAQAALEVEVLADRVVENSHGYGTSKRLLRVGGPVRTTGRRFGPYFRRAGAGPFAERSTGPFWGAGRRLLARRGHHDPVLARPLRLVERRVRGRDQLAHVDRRRSGASTTPTLAVTAIVAVAVGVRMRSASIRSRIRSASSSAPSGLVSGSATTNSSPP